MDKVERRRLEMVYVETQEEIDARYVLDERINALRDTLSGLRDKAFKTRERIPHFDLATFDANVKRKVDAWRKAQRKADAVQNEIDNLTAKADGLHSARRDMPTLRKTCQRILKTLQDAFPNEGRDAIMASIQARSVSPTRRGKAGTTTPARPTGLGQLSAVRSMTQGWTELARYGFIGWKDTVAKVVTVYGTSTQTQDERMRILAGNEGYVDAVYLGPAGYRSADGDYLGYEQWKAHMLGVHRPQCPKHKVNLHRRKGRRVWCPKCREKWPVGRIARFGRDKTNARRDVRRERDTVIDGSPSGYRTNARRDMQG